MNNVYRSHHSRISWLWNSSSFPADLQEALEKTPSDELIVHVFNAAKDHITEENRINKPIEYREGSLGPTLHLKSTSEKSRVLWQCSHLGDLYLFMATKFQGNEVPYYSAFFYRPQIGKTVCYKINPSPFSLERNDPEVVKGNLCTVFSPGGGFVFGKGFNQHCTLSDHF